MANASLRLLVLKSPDPEKLVAFYTELGAVFTAEKHGTGPRHYAAQLGDLVFEIYPAAGEQSDATTRLGFAVADVDAAVASVSSDGAPVIREPADATRGYLAIVQDPDGRRVELYRATSAPPAMVVVTAPAPRSVETADPYRAPQSELHPSDRFRPGPAFRGQTALPLFVTGSLLLVVLTSRGNFHKSFSDFDAELPQLTIAISVGGFRRYWPHFLSVRWPKSI